MRYEIGDRVVLARDMGRGMVAKIQRRKGNRLFGDRLFVRLDDGTKGTGPDGTWITNEGAVRREGGKD